MSNFLKSINTILENLAALLKLVCQAEEAGTFKHFRCNVVAKVINHDLSKELLSLHTILHEDDADLLKLIFRHRLHCLLHDSGTVLLTAEFAQIEFDILVKGIDSDVDSFAFPLRD